MGFQIKFKNPLENLSFETRGYIALGSAFFQHLILGSYYVWGGILTYVTSSLRHDGQSYTKEDVALLSPFVTLSLNIGTPFGPILANKIGYKPLMFLNSTLMGISVIGSSYYVNNFPVFVVLYGIIFGLLSGALYMVPFNTCYLYFPNKKGLVSGVITAGYALGSTALIWVMYAMINPDNEKVSVEIDGVKYFSKELTDRLPFALRILGIIQILFFYLSTLFHQRPSQQEISNIMNKKSPTTQTQQGSKLSLPTLNSLESAQQPLQTQNEIIPQNTQSQQNNNNNQNNGSQPQLSQQSENERNTQNNNIENRITTQQIQNIDIPESYYEYDTLKECLQTKFIYMSIFLAAMCAVYGSLVTNNYKILGEKSSYSDSFLNAAGTTGCVVNCISRIFWGNLMEKYSLRRVANINLSYQMFLSFTFYWCSQVEALFFLQILATFFALGGWLSMMPALIVRVYGRKIGTTIYSVTFIGFSIASFSAFFILRSASIPLRYMFWIFTGIQLFALIVCNIIDFTVKHRKLTLKTEVIQEYKNQVISSKL